MSRSGSLAIAIYFAAITFLSCVIGLKGLSCYVCHPCTDAQPKPEQKRECADERRPTGCSTSVSYITSGGTKDFKKGQTFKLIFRNCTYEDNVDGKATLACVDPSEISDNNGRKCVTKALNTADEVKSFNLCRKNKGATGRTIEYTPASARSARVLEELNLEFFSFTSCHCDGDACNNDDVDKESSFPKPQTKAKTTTTATTPAVANKAPSQSEQQKMTLFIVLLEFAVFLVANKAN